MHIHSLSDENLPVQEQLVVQRAWWHGPTRDPEPVEDMTEPLEVELLLNTSDVAHTWRNQVIEFGTIAGGEKRPQLFVVRRTRVNHDVFITTIV